MNQYFYIYPAAKSIVSIVAWILAGCAVVCTLMLLMTAIGLSGLTGLPVAETYCVFQYLSSVCLLLLAPWCVQALLAGRGTPLIRLFGYVCVFLIPIGILTTGYQAPLYELFYYLFHLLQGLHPYEDGYWLMTVFQKIGMWQCTFVVIVALLAFPYTAGYPAMKRRIFLAWTATWIFAAIIETVIMYCYRFGYNPSPLVLNAAYLGTITLQLAFWIATTYLAVQMGRNARRIADMPEMSKHEFISKDNAEKN